MPSSAFADTNVSTNSTNNELFSLFMQFIFSIYIEIQRYN